MDVDKDKREVMCVTGLQEELSMAWPVWGRSAVACLLVAWFVGLGVRPAAASSNYVFSFNSGLGSGAITLVLNGLQVIGVVGGSGTGILAGGNLSTSGNCCGNLGTSPTLNDLSSPSFFASASANQLDIKTASSQFVLSQADASSDGINQFTLGGSFVNSSIMSPETLTADPGPLPGAGLLSYLLLGFSASVYKRRSILARLRSAFGLVRARVTTPRRMVRAYV
ncbi:MAG TPA: hypothetical protein VIJ67_12170 [Pseudolabrys sp.]